MSGVRTERGGHLAQGGVGAVLDEGDQPRDGQLLATPGALDQLRNTRPPRHLAASSKPERG
jgi:hypothetical protein